MSHSPLWQPLQTRVAGLRDPPRSRNARALSAGRALRALLPRDADVARAHPSSASAVTRSSRVGRAPPECGNRKSQPLGRLCEAVPTTAGRSRRLTTSDEFIVAEVEAGRPFRVTALVRWRSSNPMVRAEAACRSSSGTPQADGSRSRPWPTTVTCEKASRSRSDQPSRANEAHLVDAAPTSWRAGSDGVCPGPGAAECAGRRREALGGAA